MPPVQQLQVLKGSCSHCRNRVRPAQGELAPVRETVCEADATPPIAGRFFGCCRREMEVIARHYEALEAQLKGEQG